MKSIPFILICFMIVWAVGAGCAPHVCYITANTLGNASRTASNASKDTLQDAQRSKSYQDSMVEEIQSVKEAEKLFDEKSGLILNY